MFSFWNESVKVEKKQVLVFLSLGGSEAPPNVAAFLNIKLINENKKKQ